jgi:hypothetical protein
VPSKLTSGTILWCLTKRQTYLLLQATFHISFSLSVTIGAYMNTYIYLMMSSLLLYPVSFVRNISFLPFPLYFVRRFHLYIVAPFHLVSQTETT